MHQQSWIFIVNPVAGNGYAADFANTVKEMANKYQVKAEFVLTERRGHATKIASEYAQQGFSHIIGVGGDGTFNEIVQGLVNRKDITFGTISAGTGNDFIHILGFSDHFTEKEWEIFFQEVK